MPLLCAAESLNQSEFIISTDNASDSPWANPPYSLGRIVPFFTLFTFIYLRRCTSRGKCTDRLRNSPRRGVMDIWGGWLQVENKVR